MVLCQLEKTSCENEEGLIIRRKRGGSHGSSTREGEENPDCALGGWVVGWLELCFNIIVKQFGESLSLAVVSTAHFDRDVDT